MRLSPCMLLGPLGVSSPLSRVSCIFVFSHWLGSDLTLLILVALLKRLGAQETKKAEGSHCLLPSVPWNTSKFWLQLGGKSICLKVLQGGGGKRFEFLAFVEGTVKKPLAWLLHDNFLKLWVRKKISIGIWKSPELREKAADWTWPGLSVKERTVGEIVR